MKRRIRVGILFGGRSAEHEVSIMSAKNIVEALDPKRYEAVLIGIDKLGAWQINDSAKALISKKRDELFKISKSSSPVVIASKNKSPSVLNLKTNKSSAPLDVVFPILHGPYGEDGTIQGLLKTMNVPFVGSGVLGSAVGMDKDVMKRLLREASLPVVHFLVARNKNEVSFEHVEKQLGLPFFVKPANLGSSVGISKVKSKSQWNKSVSDAFEFDNKIIFEQFIEGRELECAVLDDGGPRASCVGEVIPHHEFYSYEAKYLDENGATFVIPAKIEKEKQKEIQILAVHAFRTLCTESFARVDFFMDKKGTVYINEINTIPGFTRISLFPRLWEASGISYSNLINRLIDLALKKHKLESSLQTNYSKK